MSLSRRSFVQTLGAGAAGVWIGGRGLEGALFELRRPRGRRAGLGDLAG